MAITTYAELQTAVMDNLARTDLASFVPDFITLAENWMNYGSEDTSPLRVREMETIATLTPSSGVATLPTDYLQYQSVAELASCRRDLDYIAYKAANSVYSTRSSGLANHFAVVGSSLYTFPLTGNDIELVYYQAIPALSGSNTSNWLLAKAPGLYLRATLLQAAEFVKNGAETAKQGAMAKALMAGMGNSDLMGKSAHAGVVLQGITP